MNSMLAAIKKRKNGGETVMGDHGSMSHPSMHTDDADQNPNHGKDLHGLVASLSDDEKHQLKGILDGKNSAQEINKGGPSSEEKGKINQAMQAGNQKSSMEQGEEANESGVDSDEIGKSMLDSRFMSNPPAQARNLGERVKLDIHNKLKAKGKI